MRPAIRLLSWFIPLILKSWALAYWSRKIRKQRLKERLIKYLRSPSQCCADFFRGEKEVLRDDNPAVMCGVIRSVTKPWISVSLLDDNCGESMSSSPTLLEPSRGLLCIQIFSGSLYLRFHPERWLYMHNGARSSFVSMNIWAHNWSLKSSYLDSICCLCINFLFKW